MKKIIKDIKDYGYINHIASFLLIAFLIIVSKKLKLEFGIFAIIYWYVASLFMGHFAVYNVSKWRNKKWKYKKIKNDTYGAIPVAGAINIATYGIPIYLIDYFILKIL